MFEIMKQDCVSLDALVPGIISFLFINDKTIKTNDTRKYYERQSGTYLISISYYQY